MQTPLLEEKVLSVNVKSIFSKKDSHVYLDLHLPLLDQTSISGEDNPKKILDHRIKINSGFHTNFYALFNYPGLDKGNKRTNSIYFEECTCIFIQLK